MGDDNDPWNSLSSDIVDGLDSTENIKSEHAEVIEKLQDIAKISAAFKAQQQPIDTEIPRQQGTVLFSWGHLQVKEKIGEGSYGEVYRAYDSTLDRDVALKLLKQDKLAPYQSRAFIQEARRMAKVRNRHVLAVHGANVHHSKVGMWSDLIDGNDLTSAEKLSTEELFYLLESLCSALSAVHEAGLVHGDIKPSNVMQDTKGKITLMDFGAGIESEQELDSSGYLKGTPLYMAPEMFKGQAINQMTDIYALGTMMFLLISQRYPIKASSLAAIKHAHKKHAYHALKVSQHPHPKPLIQLVNQMVQHDPSQRPTTEQIFDRLAWLKATPNRRNKRLALAAIFSLFTLGISFTSIGFYRAYQAQLLTAEEKQKTDAVNDFLSNMLNLSSALGQGRDAKVADMLLVAELDMNEKYSTQPLAKAAILDAIGNSYSSLQLPQKSLELLEQSHAIKTELLPDTHPDLLKTKLNLAFTHHNLNDYKKSIELNQFVIDHASEKTKLIDLAKIRLAADLTQKGDYDAASQLLQPIAGKNPAPQNTTNNNHYLALLALTYNYMQQSNYPAAELTAQQMVDWLNNDPKAFQTNINIAKSRLAQAFSKQGKFSEAEVLLKEVLRESERFYGKQNYGYVVSLINYSIALYELGRANEAIIIQQEAYQLAQKLKGFKDQATLTIAFNLANSHVSLGQYQEGEQLMRETWRYASETLGEQHIITLQIEYNLAELLNNTDRAEEAENLARTTSLKMADSLGKDHLFTLLSNDNLAVSLSHQGLFDAAIEIHQSLLPTIQKNLGTQSPYALLAQQHFVDTLLAAKEIELARKEMTQLIENQTVVLGGDHADTQQNISKLASLK